MKLLLLVVFGVLSCICAGGNIMTIPTLPNGPALIDGELTDPCWKNAFKTGVFTEISGKIVTENTQAMFFTDGNNLYIGFICAFNDYTKKEKEMAESKGAFSNDCAEIFIDPGNTGNYIHIGINVSGKSSFIGVRDKIYYGVQVHRQNWTLEVKIPFESLKLGDGVFQKDWRLNLARGNSKIREFSSWSKLSGTSFHDQRNFTVIKGINIDLENIYRLQKEAERGNFEISLPRYLYDIQKIIAVTVDLKYTKSMKGFKLYSRLIDDKGKIVFEKKSGPVYFQNKFDIQVSELHNGRYSLLVELLNENGEILESGTKGFWKIPPKTTKPKDFFTIKNQAIFRNGQLFFPIGIWSWSHEITKDDSCGDNPEKYLASQDEISKDIKEHGMNFVINSYADVCDENFDTIRQYGKLRDYHFKTFQKQAAMGISFKTKLDRLKQQGLYLVAYMPYLGERDFREEHIAQWVEMMLKYRDYDNIMLWFTSDESDGEFELNKLRTQLFKEIDPDRLTYLNVINAVAQNKDAADVLATDPYPIPQGKVTLVVTHMKRLLANIKSTQSPWLWLQIFGGEGSWTRPPTPEEIKVMIFLALNHGVKGICYFTYQSPENRKKGVRMNEKTWESLKTVNAQVQELALVYCLGERIVQETQATLDVTVIRNEEAMYVSVANTENASIMNASITIPLVKKASGEVLYENRKVFAVDGIITDKFNGYDVHVYKFKL